MKLWLYFVGKPKDAHLNAVAADYVMRAARYMPMETREIQPARFDLFSKHPTANKVLLDPLGKPLDSAAFAKLIGTAEFEARDVVFLVGGHDGLPPEWRARATLLLALSALTMPHELARAVLAEQIYRALTMLRGHPYPR